MRQQRVEQATCLGQALAVELEHGRHAEIPVKVAPPAFVRQRIAAERAADVLGQVPKDAAIRCEALREKGYLCLGRGDLEGAASAFASAPFFMINTAR